MWKKINNFDEDIVKGDKVVHNTWTKIQAGIVTAIGEDRFLMKVLNGHNLSELDYEKDISEQFYWLVWKEPKRWRAEIGKIYFAPDISLGEKSRGFIEVGSQLNDMHFNSYFYFKTEIQAQRAADKIKELLIQFHGGERSE